MYFYVELTNNTTKNEDTFKQSSNREAPSKNLKERELCFLTSRRCYLNCKGQKLQEIVGDKCYTRFMKEVAKG